VNNQIHIEPKHELPPASAREMKFLQIFFITQFVLFFISLLAGIIAPKFSNPVTIITLCLSSLLFIACGVYLFIRYQKTPIVQEKDSHIKHKNKIEGNIKRTQKSISDCENNRNRISKDETKILHQRKSAHEKTLSGIKQNRENFKQSEILRLSDELKNLQHKFILEGLKNTYIVDEKIRGFGKVTKKKWYQHCI